VVILFVDQLRWSEVGCYGNAVIRTPHLDGLAGEGVRFGQAFANFPSCSPARSTLLSGRHARSNGLYANQQQTSPGRPTNRDTTLPEAMRAAGYTTAMIGKWHLTPTPRTLGFEMSWQGGTGPGGDGYMRGPWRADGGIGSNHIYEGYTLEHQSELAADFMRRHRGKPFLLYLTPAPPHMPIASLPARYKQMYDPARMPIRPNAYREGKLPFDERWFSIYLGENANTPVPEGMTLRDLYALYYGQVTGVDDWVGRILQAIRDLELEDNTIVLFSSDHGDLLGSHHLFNKNSHYDEACRIPLLVRWPGHIRPCVQDQELVSLVDVMPTLLDLCGVKQPGTIQGASFAPLLREGRQPGRENLAFIETTANEGVRTPRHVYWCNRRTFGDEHLFDLAKDPFETTDVAGDPAYRTVLEELRTTTAAWRQRTPAEPAAEQTTRERPTRRAATAPR
jgi:arylsulfatase A-like enzyme